MYKLTAHFQALWAKSEAYPTIIPRRWSSHVLPQESEWTLR